MSWQNNRKKKLREALVVYTIGAVGYPLLELATRRRTHWSMSVAGGISFCAIYRIHNQNLPLFERAARGALSVTCVELVIGLVVNKLFHKNVWDYSKRRFNVLGQVCAHFSCVWFVLCAALSPFCRSLQLYFSRKAA